MIKRSCVCSQRIRPSWDVSKEDMSRGPNEILQSRNPDPKFVQSRNPKGYIWHPTSRAYFQYRNSPQFCFQIPNPELQITENPGPEKPIWDPHVAVSPFRLSLPPFPQKRLILRLCVWSLQVKIVPRFFFSLVSSYALEIGKIGEGSF